MKTILDGLKFCKDNKIYTHKIKIALGINKIPLTFKEGFNQLRIKNG